MNSGHLRPDLFLDASQRRPGTVLRGFHIENLSPDRCLPWRDSLVGPDNRQSFSQKRIAPESTYGPASAYINPATSGIIRGQGAAGWFGWWENANAEQLVQDWLDAPDPVRQKQLAQELAKLAMDELPFIPVGQWFGKTAYRKSITGVMQGAAPYPWNVRPA